MPENADYSSLTQLIKELRKKADDGLSKHKARAALYEIEQAIKELGLLAQDLDPVKRPENVFDPRDPTIVGLFVGMALVAQERRGLIAVTEPFYGSGVYALYYAGDFKPYAPISKTEHPIYVGKADPQEPQATEDFRESPGVTVLADTEWDAGFLVPDRFEQIDKISFRRVPPPI